MIGIPAIFVVLQPNLGTTLIIVADGCSLLFLAGLSWWWIAPTLAGVVAAVPLAWRFVLHDYQKARVETFIHPEDDALGKGWNITQAKIAIGSGGRGGQGLPQGTQSRLNFLPEKQTDFIWTSVCEEFGFVGALAVLVLFAVVIFYGVQTPMSARSQFGRLLAMGVTLNFFYLHHDQRVDGDGPDPRGGHPHAAAVLWRQRHADGDVRIRPFDERSYPPPGRDSAPFRRYYLSPYFPGQIRPQGAGRPL